jgi:DNA-binding transcriptional ArsR family regulator
MPTLDGPFAALADPTRRDIIARLAEGEATVQDLARPFAISQPAISRHLKVLEDAGLIETRIQGTARPRRLKPDAMAQLWHWLGQYRALWEDQFKRLDAVLDKLDDTPSEGPTK